MQVPVEVEIAIEIRPHQWLADVSIAQQLVEELHNLVAVHRAVKIRRECRYVDALTLVVRATFLQTLEKYGHPLTWIWLPGLSQQTPKIVRKRILLGELDADHR